MKVGVSWAGRGMYTALTAAQGKCREEQERVLREIVSYAKETVYGKEHAFSRIRSVADFQDAVPVNEYEALRPYIARHAQGEENVLFPGKPLFYATTSGTTSEPKRIPITRRYNDACYNGLTKLWLASMFDETPDFLNGCDLTMVGKTIEGYTEDGTSYGSLSGHMNAYMPEFLKRFRIIPQCVHDIDDYHAKYYTLLRLALEYEVRWIVAANPSSLLAIALFAEEMFDAIVEDIAKGTLRTDIDVAPAIRERVVARLRPNPRRAKRLASLARKHARLLPKHYWPTLRMINTWTLGNAGLYLARTEGFFPERTVVREFGYIATEARAGIILRNDQKASILPAHLLFFEFVHQDDIESAHPAYLLAHELDVGESYYIFITTQGGLYRYAMNDILRMEGRYGTFPMMRFIQKGKGVTSLTGEKVYEAQYIAAVADAANTLSCEVAFHVAFADITTSRYHVFVEFEGDVSDVVTHTFITHVDEALARMNIEYHAKRRSNRILLPYIYRLRPNAFEAYKREMLARGMREGQFKMTHLSDDNERMKLFKLLTQTRL